MNTQENDKPKYDVYIGCARAFDSLTEVKLALQRGTAYAPGVVDDKERFEKLERLVTVTIDALQNELDELIAREYETKETGA